MSNTKALKIMVAIAIILATLVSYLGWKNVQTNQELNDAQSNMQSTQNELKKVQDYLRIESEKTTQALEQINSITSELEVANTTVADLKGQEYELIYLGDFKLTHYCNEFYEHVCGYGDGLTATGTNVTPGRTIAVDPKVIPYGTQVYIEGYGWRVAEDCGGSVKGNHIDIAVNTHSEAMDIGIKNGGVWILVKKGS